LPPSKPSPSKGEGWGGGDKNSYMLIAGIIIFSELSLYIAINNQKKE